MLTHRAQLPVPDPVHVPALYAMYSVGFVQMLKLGSRLLPQIASKSSLIDPRITSEDPRVDKRFIFM